MASQAEVDADSGARRCSTTAGPVHRIFASIGARFDTPDGGRLECDADEAAALRSSYWPPGLGWLPLETPQSANEGWTLPVPYAKSHPRDFAS
jgi:hypothetical protein